MTGGGGVDTYVVAAGEASVTIGGTGNAGTISGYDIIANFSSAADILDLAGSPSTPADDSGQNGQDSTLTISGQTIKSHAISNGVITFDDQNNYNTAVSLGSTANVAAVVQYLQQNDLGGAGTTGAFTVTFGGNHSFIYEQVGDAPDASQDLLIELQGLNITNLASLIGTRVKPAGVSGEAINLALINPVDQPDAVIVNVSGIAAGWALSEGVDNGDGTWTVQTNDQSSLNVITAPGFAGAAGLNIAVTWTNVDGTTGTMLVHDNVEAYAPGSPIFAWSGDDTLTASAGQDLFVFSQPIGYDVVYSFDVSSDRIDLIGYGGISSFADVAAHTTEGASGNTVITLADGQSITLKGVHAADLTADNFVFDLTPVTDNPGTMSIGNGAMLPLSGDINNTGTIELNSTGDTTLLQLIQHGITLSGAGHVVLSDNGENVITGTVPDVYLVNLDNTISGAGQLGAGQMDLDNHGTIIATGTNAFVIDTGANAITNSGTLEATSSSGLVINSAVDNSGELWAHGGNITANGAVNGGSVVLDGQATLEFGAAVSANVTLDAAATGKLVLNDSFDFSGTVSGFNGDDQLDLRDIAFGANTSVSYAENQDHTGGVLSVTDGSHTANISLLGQYSADGFSLVADDHIGTLLAYQDHLI
jgi:hypothetical protein